MWWLWLHLYLKKTALEHCLLIFYITPSEQVQSRYRSVKTASDHKPELQRGNRVGTVIEQHRKFQKLWHTVNLFTSPLMAWLLQDLTYLYLPWSRITYNAHPRAFFHICSLSTFVRVAWEELKCNNSQKKKEEEKKRQDALVESTRAPPDDTHARFLELSSVPALSRAPCGGSGETRSPFPCPGHLDCSLRWHCRTHSGNTPDDVQNTSSSCVSRRKSFKWILQSAWHSST